MSLTGFPSRQAPLLTSDAALSDIVGQVYEHGHTSAGLRAVMSCIRNLFGASRACLTQFVDGSTESIQATDDPEFLCADALDAFRRDPIFSATRRMPVGKSFLQDDIAQSDQFHKGELFCDWYRPRDMFSGLSANVASTGGANWFLDVQRGKNQQSFDRADVATLDIVVRHLMRAWSVAAQIKREGIETTIAAMSDAVFLLDHDGKVEAMNEHARTFLARDQDALHLGPMNRLKGRNRNETGKINSLIDMASATPLPDARELLLRDDVNYSDQEPLPGGLVLRAIRLPDAELADTKGSPTLLAVRALNGSEYPGITDLVLREFGLTPAETRIALAIATGRSLKEAAAISQISFNTARFHLRQVFSKTGTRQQSQLVALLRPL